MIRHPFFLSFYVQPQGMSLSKPAIATAVVGLSALGFTWYTRPEPYPPSQWSKEAKKFPDHVSRGLGPLLYYYPEKGVRTPIDRIPDNLKSSVSSIEELMCVRPGIDCGVNEYNSGLVMQDTSSYRFAEKTVEKFKKSDRLAFSQKSPSLMAPVCVSMKRNLKSLPFMSSISFEGRRQVEDQVLSVLEGHGTYYPLIGSRSTGSKPMSKIMLDVLRSQGLVFEAPWTAYDLSTGIGRHWPDARGVFLVTPDETGTEIVVWVNHEDHVELVGIRQDGDAEKILNCIEKISAKFDTVKDSAIFGHLTTKPENSGIGMTVSYQCDLSKLSKHKRFVELCGKLRVKPMAIGNGIFNIASFEKFGLTEKDCIDRTRSSVAKLIELESTTTFSGEIDKLVSD
jgi:hypothetical protein